MSQRLPFRVICAFAALAAPAHGDIIDRIAVSVGNRVITQSDLDRATRVYAFQEGTKPDLSPAARRAMAERLVEQKLIQVELETARYPLPDPGDLTPAMEEFKKKHYKSEEEYQRALAEYGITEQDLKDLLLWERKLVTFIDIRFQTGIQVTPQEIQDYFDEVVKPLAQTARPGKAPDLEEYREQIEQTLSARHTDQDMEKWLKEARQRTEIIFHDEVFR